MYLDPEYAVRKITWSGEISNNRVQQILPRAEQSVDQVLPAVEQLLAEIRTQGLPAVISQTEKFDRVKLENVRVSQSKLDESLAELPSNLRSALEEAITRVHAVSEAVLPTSTASELAPGALVTTRWQPVDSVGIYAPGGKAVYPSSVLMNAIPALAAKVPRVALFSPPQLHNSGLPDKTVLAAAALLGISEVYAIGGATAVGAMTYGLPEIGLEPLSMITGPGNIYFAAAKRAVRGQIGIDSEAGPTEILIVADATSDARLIAADLISQAEHDENAAAVLLTDSATLVSQVEQQVNLQLENLKNAERIQVALAGQQSALVLVDSIASAIEIANHYATEHLEIHCEDPQLVANQITNAGAIFLGNFSPVSLGDYLAGSNHVLPTGQQAKFGPGLGVHSFLRPQQIIDYKKEALGDVVQKLSDFANAEGLDAHARAAEIRFE